MKLRSQMHPRAFFDNKYNPMVKLINVCVPTMLHDVVSSKIRMYIQHGLWEDVRDAAQMFNRYQQKHEIVT